MIGGVTSHGRTSRDSGNLSSHLLKDRPEVEIRNSAASTLREAMSDMEIARDGSRAEAAFLHMYISPSRDMSRDDLAKAADIAIKHFGAEDHAAALVYHDKPRIGGEGGSHVHIVLSRVGPEGQVLPSGFDKIRMETAMRLAEFELGEAPTLGRHTASGIKWMKANGRPEVAAWLENSHGSNPEKPRSAMSPDARQGLDRKGVVMGAVRETVTAAWQQSDDAKSFSAAMANSGLTITKGDKSGVFLVHQGETQIGALDRIIKEKRAVVATRMEGFEHVENNRKSEAAITNGSPQSDMERSSIKQEERGATSTPVDSFREARRERGWANRGDTGGPRSDPSIATSSNDADRGYGSKNRRFDKIQASRKIEAHKSGWDRLRDLRNDLKSMIDRWRGIPETTPPEVTNQFSERDQQIADVFAKACRFSAENMEKLERLDPDLAAYREQYGEQCQQMSRDEILENLESWRRQGADLSSDLEQDDDLGYQPSLRPQ